MQDIARMREGEFKMEKNAQPVLSVRRIVVTGVLGAIAILLGYTRLGFIPVPTPAGNATIMHIPAIIGGILEGWPVGAAIGTIFGIFSFLYSTTPIFKDPLVAILPRIFIGITPYFVYQGLRRMNRTAGFAIAAAILVLAGIFAYDMLTFVPKDLAFDFGGDPTSPWIHLTGQTALLIYQIIGALMVLLGLGAGITFAFLAQRNQMELLAIGTAAVVGTLTNTVLVLTMIVVRGYLTADVALGIGITQGIPEIIVAVLVTVAVVAAWKGIESGAGGGAKKV
jgi:uncharacterized membrane protein